MPGKFIVKAQKTKEPKKPCRQVVLDEATYASVKKIKDQTGVPITRFVADAINYALSQLEVVEQ